MEGDKATQFGLGNKFLVRGVRGDKASRVRHDAVYVLRVAVRPVGLREASEVLTSFASSILFYPKVATSDSVNMVSAIILPEGFGSKRSVSLPRGV